MVESSVPNSLVNSPPTFGVTAESLSREPIDIQHAYDELHEKIISSVEPARATFENTVVPLALLENRLELSAQKAQLLAAVSDDKSIRTAASESFGKLANIFKGRFTRQDIFERVKNVHHQLRETDSDPEPKKVVKNWVEAFVNAGCQLGPEARQQLATTNESITRHTAAFIQTLVESTEAVFFTREELSGLPPGTLDGLEAGSGPHTGKLRLPLRDSVVKSVMSNVHDANVRKTVFEQSEMSLADSLRPFVDTMKCRQEKAKLLGFDSFAAHCLSTKMARDPETVESFLEGLRAELTPLALQELQGLKELKRTHLKLPTDAPLDEYYLWDQPYYHELQLKQRYQVDNQQLAEYFPLKPTLTNMLKIFEDVFSVTFHEVDESMRSKLAENPRDLTWHDDVLMFTVWDRQSVEQENDSAFIGYLYADVFSRDGKPPGNANYNIHPGFTDADGKRHPVATALVMAFPPASPTDPVLLQHRQVIIMFHELGHAMHDLLARTRFASLHGHRTTLDFVETPSQVLENWCWVGDELSKIGRHYTYISAEYAEAWRSEHPSEELPPERLPEAMAAKLTSSRSVNLALSSLRQIHLGRFDMYAHGSQDISESELKRWFHENREAIGLIRSSDETPSSLGHSFVTTTHYISGSACNYYSYLFSQVYSSDIFHAAFKKDPRDREVGKRYRELILQPGGTYEPMDMIREFLGRNPEKNAFYHDIGLAEMDK